MTKNVFLGLLKFSKYPIMTERNFCDMKIILAKSAGFCFGVKRAVDTVYQQVLLNQGKIYTYGPIIHNEEVVKDQ